MWDTVGSIVHTIHALHIADTSLPTIIDHALHALSMHENELLILPTLWTIPKEGLSKMENGRDDQVLKQVKCSRRPE